MRLLSLSNRSFNAYSQLSSKMNKLSLILRGLAIVCGLVAGGAWLMTDGKLDSLQHALNAEKTAHQSTRGELATSEDHATTLESDLKQARSDLAAQTRQVTRFQNQTYAASREMSRLQTALQETEVRIEQVTSDNERLKREILAVKSAPPPDIDDSEVVRGYKYKIRELEREIRELQNRLSGAPVMATATAPDASAPGTAFRIRAVVAAYRPEAGMLLLNRGLDSGIRRSGEYALHKNGTEVGRIRVTTVENAASVATLLAGSTDTASLRTGDTVLLVQ